MDGRGHSIMGKIIITINLVNIEIMILF
jgi:hypothetical protein